MREGYVYTASADGLFDNAQIGERLTTGRTEPPWIVVNHDLPGILLNKWPSRLLRVRVVLPADTLEAQAFAEANSNLIQPPKFTRAFTVDVLEETPIHALFQVGGRDVVKVFNQALTLTQPQALALAQAIHPQAPQLYEKAWQAWLSQDEAAFTLVHEGTTLHTTSGSPVGYSFSLIHSLVWDAAKAMEGEAAFVVIDDEEELREPWASAVSALCHVVMTYGAPHLVADPAPLARAWERVFGATSLN